MATGKENSDENRLIEDLGAISQSPEIISSSSHSDINLSATRTYPTVLAVPVIPSRTHSPSSQSSNSSDRGGITSSHRVQSNVLPQKSVQSSIHQFGTSSSNKGFPMTSKSETKLPQKLLKISEQSSSKIVTALQQNITEPASTKIVPTLYGNSKSVCSKIVPAHQNVTELSCSKTTLASQQNSTVLGRNNTVKESCQSTSDLTQNRFERTLHKLDPLTTTDICSDSEPLNLTVGSKGNENVISSSLFGVISKEHDNEKATETDAEKSAGSSYKIQHPIGSRKVTEYVITYHEQMFQSVANTLFENKKNLMMGKRNADEERNKGDSSSPEYKKRKLETPISPNKDGKTIVKKKCTIENIIERIRTEKTLSRGGSAQVVKPVEQEKTKIDSLQSEKQKMQITLPKQKKSESNIPKLKKTGSISPIQQRDGSCSSEVKNIDSNSSKQKSDGSSSWEPKNIDSVSPNQLGDAGSFPKQKLVECSSMKQMGDGSACPKQNTIDSKYLKHKRNEDISQKKSNNCSSKQKKPKTISQTTKSESGSQTGSGNYSIKCNEVQGKKVKKKESESNEYLSVISKQMKNNNGTGADIIKTYKKKDINDGKTIIKTKKIKTEKEYIKYDNMEIKKSIGEKVKVKRNLQQSLNKSIGEPKHIESKKKGDARTEDEKKTKPGRKKSLLEEKSWVKPKITKQKKQKLQIACRRVKREASLNATMFLNILNEKSPRVSKLSAQRSKSDSDINHTPILSIQSSHSMTNVGAINCSENDNCLITKKEKMFSHKDLLTPKKEPKSPKKTKSPKRKVSFSDDVFDAVFEAVIQKSIETNEKCNKQPRSGEAMGTVRKTGKEMKCDDKTKKKKDNDLKIKDKIKKCVVTLKPEKKDKKFRLQKIKQAIKMTVTKSPEEVAEKKRKANLARLERARELINTERKVSEKNCVDERDSDDSVSIISEKDESQSIDQCELEANTEEVKKMKAKKGALCRAARTHVSVEAKTVVENAMPSARWCECCQSSYYPCQPTRGTQVWRIKHLVDKDSSKSPEPIQSSSNHFIAAHASCEVRPYASPSHVSVIDSTPYVGQIMPHGHIQCSACSCGHSGVFHPGPGQCQNCTLGGVSSMLPCQRYGSTYSVTYPHTHGSYTHCGCGACYPAGSYHHSVGQTLIHPPQISLSTESPILLHHPVQLQVAHEAPLPVTMPPIAHSHSDPSLAHSVQPVSLQLGHSEQSLQNLTHMCQLSQGEVTNVSIMASNSPSDHEIDVGTRDDIAKSVPKLLSSSGLKRVDQVFKSIKNKKGNSSIDSTSKIQSSKSIEIPIKDSTKVKMAENSNDETDFQLKLKEKKKSNLLLIKQKQKQLEQKSLKNAQKKDLRASSAKPEISLNDKKVKDKIKATELPIPKKEKVKRSASIETKNEETVVNEHLKRAWHGWSWEGMGVMKKVTDIFDGQTVQRKCYNAIRHDDGDTIQVKDCVLVCSGQKEKDIPFVAKVSNFWEDSVSGEMMMSVLWFYRPEHAEGGPIFGSLENEVFAAKHRDETLVACIEDRGFVLTYNEYCRFMAEVERTKSDFPLRKKVVPEPEDPYPSNRIPPVDVNPENVFLCRQVYDIKLKRVLKNPS